MSLERLDPASVGDVTEVVSILTGAFGDGFTEERIRQLAADPKMFVAVARVDGTIAFLTGWLREQGCEVVAAASWGTGGPDTSRGLFERHGFGAVQDIPGETYRLTNLKGRPCPVCGIPCECSGTLLVRSVGRSD